MSPPRLIFVGHSASPSHCIRPPQSDLNVACALHLHLYSCLRLKLRGFGHKAESGALSSNGACRDFAPPPLLVTAPLPLTAQSNFRGTCSNTVRGPNSAWNQRIIVSTEEAGGRGWAQPALRRSPYIGSFGPLGRIQNTGVLHRDKY